MLAYVAPSVLLLVGVLGIVTWHVGSSDRVLSRRTAAQRRELLDSFRSRSSVLLPAALALLCLVGVVSSIWSGTGAWWLWLVALASQVAVHLARERAGRRTRAYFDEDPVPRTQQERLRDRYVLVYGGIAIAAFLVGELVMPDPGVVATGARVVVGAVLLVVALLAAAAAGWAAVWAYRGADGSGRS